MLRDACQLIVIATAMTLAGCFQVIDPTPSPSPSIDKALAGRVKAALAGHEQHALAYAGCYDVLADRLEAQAYATTSDAAKVAGRAADILELPGALKEIVDDELNPLLGKPQPITPELAADAAAKLRALSSACREVAP